MLSPKIAIRNVFRYKKRSLFVFFAIMFSVFIVEAVFGFIDGFRTKFVEDMFQDTGHIIIHKEGYKEKVELYPLNISIQDYEKVGERVKKIEQVEEISYLIKFGCIANNFIWEEGQDFEDARSINQQAQAIGLNPEMFSYSRIKEKIIEGRFLSGEKEIVLGHKLADKLEVELGNKIMLLAVDADDTFIYNEFEIVGFFKTLVKAEDESLILTHLTGAQNLLSMEGKISEIDIMLSDYKKSETIAENINKQFPEKEIKAYSWKEYNEAFLSMLGMMDMFIAITIGFLMLIAATGIINTVLTSVFERFRIIGTMRAVGMEKIGVIRMILIEFGFIGLLGAIIGALLGSVLVLIFQNNPIQFDAFGEIAAGYGSILKMEFKLTSFLISIAVGVGTAVLGALYPAIIAVRAKIIKTLTHV